MPITILLADDHQMMREGLRALLEQEQDLEVVGEAADGRAAVRMAEKLSPDVVVMDVAMPDLNGLEATRQIYASSPATKVIALSIHSDGRFVAGMFRAGAAGYLLKDSAFDELAHAIRTAFAKHTYLSPAISDVVIQAYLASFSGHAHEASPSPLTSREQEVLQLLAEGHSTRQIAGKLSLSRKTIETHRARIMEKLDIHSIAGLTKYAIREGLTSLALLICSVAVF